jgi:hypothetical protein
VYHSKYDIKAIMSIATKKPAHRFRTMDGLKVQEMRCLFFVVVMGTGIFSMRPGGKDNGVGLDIVEVKGAVFDASGDADTGALSGGELLAVKVDDHFARDITRMVRIGAYRGQEFRPFVDMFRGRSGTRALINFHDIYVESPGYHIVLDV